MKEAGYPLNPWLRNDRPFVHHGHSLFMRGLPAATRAYQRAAVLRQPADDAFRFFPGRVARQGRKPAGYRERASARARRPPGKRPCFWPAMRPIRNAEPCAAARFHATAPALPGRGQLVDLPARVHILFVRRMACCTWPRTVSRAAPEAQRIWSRRTPRPYSLLPANHRCPGCNLDAAVSNCEEMEAAVRFFSVSGPRRACAQCRKSRGYACRRLHAPGPSVQRR